MTDSRVEAPSGRSRRRRWLIRLLVGVPLVLVSTLVVIVVALPWFFPPESLRRTVVSALTENLGIDAEIGGLDYHPLTGVELTDVRVKPPAGFDRDPVRADRIAVRYSVWPLLTGEAAVRTVVLENAHVVLENRDGRSNLDALLSDISEALGPREPKPPAEPKPAGPLSPIAVRLESLALGPLTFEVAGDGPNAKISDVWVRGTGQIGSQTLTASVTATIEPSTPASNLTFALPAESDAASSGAPPGPRSGPTAGRTSGELMARARLPIDLVADSAQGFRLGRASVALDLAIRGTIDRPQGPVPPVELVAGLTASAEPAAQRAALSRLRLALDGRTLLDAHASAEGLWTLFHRIMDEERAGALATTAGLQPDDTADHLEAEVVALHLPLTELAPLAQAVLPGLVELKGSARARAFRVAGGVDALGRGRPPVLSGDVRAENVRCVWPGVLLLEALDGGLSAGRQDTGAYTAQGQFRAERLSVAGQKIGEGRLALAAGVDQLDMATGATTATVSLAVTDLSSPAVSASSVSAHVYLRGRDPLQRQRAEEAPVDVKAAVEATKVEIGSVLSMRRAEITASLTADRLVDTARRPWAVSIEADVERFRQAAIRFGVGRLAVAGKLGDVRRPGYSTDLEVDGWLRRVETVGITSPRFTLKGTVAVDEIRRRSFPPRRESGPPRSKVTLPARVSVDLAARAKPAQYRGLKTPLGVDLDGTLDFVDGQLRVRRGRVRLGRDARLDLSGRLLRLLEGQLRGGVRAKLDVPDVGRVWSKVPAELRGGATDLEAQGGLSASLSLRGRLPAPLPAQMDWSKPPATVAFTARARNLRAQSERLGVSLHGMTATVAARLSPGVASFVPRAEVARFAYQERLAVAGLRLDGTVGLEDGVWRAITAAKAVEIVTELDGRRLADAASFDLDARYVPRGELMVERLDARLPSAGLLIGLKGRMRRDEQARFVPEVDIDADVGLSRLSALVPMFRAGTGRVRAELSTRPGPANTLRLDGRMNANTLSWSTPAWSVRSVTGAIPVAQTLYLPPLTDASEAPSGRLGDDMEVQLAVLTRRLQQAQLVVDPSTDILAAAPRTADYYALGPYRNPVDAELVAAELRLVETPLTNVRAEARLEEGVLRIDRFQAELWEGDLLFDLAVQVTPDLDVKTRLRGTMTDINLDIPYAKAKNIEPVSDPGDKAEYLASGIMDFEFGLNENVLDGQIDVVRLSKPLVERLFGAMDPSGKSSAAEALGYSEIAAVRPVSAKLWVAQNLLNVQFEWERVLGFDDFAPWWLALDTILFAPRIVSAWVLGGAWVIPTVNNSVRRASVFNFIDPYLGPFLEQATAGLARFQSRVVSASDVPGLTGDGVE